MDLVVMCTRYLMILTAPFLLHRTEDLQIPRGILNYHFSRSNGTSVNWKVTGNLGGEHVSYSSKRISLLRNIPLMLDFQYIDRIRGPLNEGGLYPERQGFHQPGVDTRSWKSGSPLEGLSEAGIRFYRYHAPSLCPPSSKSGTDTSIKNNLQPRYPLQP